MPAASSCSSPWVRPSAERAMPHFGTPCSTRPTPPGDGATQGPWPERVGDPVITSRAMMLRFRNSLEAGDIEDADLCRKEFERLTAELGQPALAWVAGVHPPMRVLLSGDVGEAERLTMANFELGRATGQPDAFLFFLAQLFCVGYEPGRLAEMAGRVKDGVSGRP